MLFQPIAFFFSDTHVIYNSLSINKRIGIQPLKLLGRTLRQVSQILGLLKPCHSYLSVLWGGTWAQQGKLGVVLIQLKKLLGKLTPDLEMKIVNSKEETLDSIIIHIFEIHNEEDVLKWL